MGELNTFTSAPYVKVVQRTARLVALWQCMGFCHGVQNTDNMSILGLTIDYGLYGFMDRFDPDFICNASDTGRRYTYQAQPYVCHCNLLKLAEALMPGLPLEASRAILEEFDAEFDDCYLTIMQTKLGLLRQQVPEDKTLVTVLLETMNNTDPSREIPPGSFDVTSGTEPMEVDLTSSGPCDVTSGLEPMIEEHGPDPYDLTSCLPL
ncbi:SELO protein, partial [Polypterus senegalus]